VVLATGGQSLPKTGSDGAGYAIARRLGHTIVPTTPALAPLRLADEEPLHRRLTGVSQDVELSIWIDGAVAPRLARALLWTHVGVSGPVAMNASRHWLRARVEDRTAALSVSFMPGRTFDDVDEWLVDRATATPTTTVRTTLATAMPASTVDALLDALAVDGSTV